MVSSSVGGPALEGSWSLHKVEIVPHLEGSWSLHKSLDLLTEILVWPLLFFDLRRLFIGREVGLFPVIVICC